MAPAGLYCFYYRELYYYVYYYVIVYYRLVEVRGVWGFRLEV